MLRKWSWPPRPAVPFTRRGSTLAERIRELGQLHQVKRANLFKRYQGAPVFARQAPVLLGDTAADESALFRQLHAAAKAKYAATHGPAPDPAAAAEAERRLADLSRAYLALGHTADELERLKQSTLLDRASETLSQLGNVLLVGGGLFLALQLLGSRPARRMDF